MSEFFLKIVNMSISASWLVLAVLGVRLVLKRAPKWVYVLLWGIVAVRLLFPLSFESALSLLPSTETISETALSGSGIEIQTGIAPVDDRVNDYLGDYSVESAAAPENNSTNILTVLSIVWLIGAVILVAYTAVSYWRLQRKVDTAVLLRENIFQSESVLSPFVLGIIRPRIFLPFNIDEQDMKYVIAHEAAHIRRKDHWWKPVGFLLLTIHWFNPLMWLAYVLLCRDIELACDEKVIHAMNHEDRADYTQVLVSCSVNRRMITSCPLAFGEVGVRKRVKSVMNYRKPALWTVALSVIACGVLAVGFLTNPLETDSVNEPNISEETTLSAADHGKTESNQWKEKLAQIEADRLELEDRLKALKEEEEALKAEEEKLEALKAEAESNPQDVTTQITALLDTIAEANQAEFMELCGYGEETLHYCFSAILSGKPLGEYGPIMTAVCHEIAGQWGDELLLIVTSDSDNLHWVDDLDSKIPYLLEKYGAEMFAEMYPATWIFLQLKNE